MKWETCFLCGYDFNVYLKCFVTDSPVNLDMEKKCKDCPYYVTTHEVREKYLHALGLTNSTK